MRLGEECYLKGSKICHPSLGGCLFQWSSSLSSRRRRCADVTTATAKGSHGFLEAGSKPVKPTSENLTDLAVYSFLVTKGQYGLREKKKISSRSLPPAHQVPYSQSKSVTALRTCDSNTSIDFRWKNPTADCWQIVVLLQWV